MSVIMVDETLSPLEREMADSLWEQIYDSWRYSRYTPRTNFTSIEFKAKLDGHPRFRHPRETIDWWPNEYFDKMLDSMINFRGRYFNETKKGTLHTAGLLFDALQASETEPDLEAAVWVAAWSENEHKQDWPKGHWNYEKFQVINKINTAARNRLAHGLAFTQDMMPNWWGVWWHHSMRDIVPCTPPLEMFVPTNDIREIVRIITVSATVSLANHTLVHIKAT